MGLSIILLAAGEGKRMKTDLPKPLIKLGDIPMVQHSLNTSMKLNPDRLILVTGYKKDEVKKYVLAENSGDFIFCEQKERLGTGHAVKQALPYLPENGKTLVLYADVPLVSLGTLRKLIRSCIRKKMSILTMYQSVSHESVLHTSKQGGRAHTHTHAAHDWLGSRHEAQCHRP